MRSSFVSASGIVLSFFLAACGGEDPVSQASYATGAASAIGQVNQGCEAVLVAGARVLTTARCAEGASSVAFGGEERAVTQWIVDRTRDSAVGALEHAPAGPAPLEIAPPHVGCDYTAGGTVVCIDALASGAVLKSHGACGAREGAPLVDGQGRLVGVALSTDCTRFLSAIEQSCALP
jgi:hypothetical protein